MNEQWKIGDITVTRVVEMEVAGGTECILPDATKEAALELDWMAPHFSDGGWWLDVDGAPLA